MVKISASEQCKSSAMLTQAGDFFGHSINTFTVHPIVKTALARISLPGAHILGSRIEIRCYGSRGNGCSFSNPSQALGLFQAVGHEAPLNRLTVTHNHSHTIARCAL
jgi:hypothetical protein